MVITNMLTHLFPTLQWVTNKISKCIQYTDTHSNFDYEIYNALYTLTNVLCSYKVPETCSSAIFHTFLILYFAILYQIIELLILPDSNWSV